MRSRSNCPETSDDGSPCLIASAPGALADETSAAIRRAVGEYEAARGAFPGHSLRSGRGWRAIFRGWWRFAQTTCADHDGGGGGGRWGGTGSCPVACQPGRRPFGDQGRACRRRLASGRRAIGMSPVSRLRGLRLRAVGGIFADGCVDAGLGVKASSSRAALRGSGILVGRNLVECLLQSNNRTVCGTACIMLRITMMAPPASVPSTAPSVAIRKGRKRSGPRSAAASRA